MAEITFEQLEKADACDNKLAFKELFGDKAKITPALARKHATEFDWDWAAEKLLPVNLNQQFQKAMESYRLRHRADVELADYALKYTRMGHRRYKPTDKQKEVHRKAVDALHRRMREFQADLFARLYIGKGSTRTPKTEKLLDDFGTKLDKLIEHIFEVNYREGYSSWSEISSRLETLLDNKQYHVSGIGRSINRRLEDERREKERAKRQEEINQANMLRPAAISGPVRLGQEISVQLHTPSGTIRSLSSPVVVSFDPFE